MESKCPDETARARYESESEYIVHVHRHTFFWCDQVNCFNCLQKQASISLIEVRVEVGTNTPEHIAKQLGPAISYFFACVMIKKLERTEQTFKQSINKDKMKITPKPGTKKQ